MFYYKWQTVITDYVQVIISFAFGSAGTYSNSGPPPPPVSNAWDKPLQLPYPNQALATVTQSAVGVSSVVTVSAKGSPGKPEAGSNDQHDSGIELNSDHHASNPPSQRSSPSGDTKHANKLMVEAIANSSQPSGIVMPSQTDWSSGVGAVPLGGIPLSKALKTDPPPGNRDRLLKGSEDVQVSASQEVSVSFVKEIQSIISFC